MRGEWEQAVRGEGEKRGGGRGESRGGNLNAKVSVYCSRYVYTMSLDSR